MKDLPKLSINQIVFWDEMHKEQIVGYVGKKSYQFNCDPNGKYDLQGKIMTDASSRLHMKYPEQAHLLLGIAPVLLSDGKEEGR